MGDVGVLILVDENVTEPILIDLQNVRVLLKQGQAVQQQITEIRRVQYQQPILILGIDLAQLAAGEIAGIRA